MSQINLRVSDDIKKEMKETALASGFGGVSGYLKFLHHEHREKKQCNTKTDTNVTLNSEK